MKAMLAAEEDDLLRSPATMSELDVDDTLQSIIDAFAGVKLGDGISLHEAVVIDGYGSAGERREARAGDETLDWKRIPDDTIECQCWVLCFMDSYGLRFHWPAWMCFALRNCRTSDSMSTDAIIYSLCRHASDCGVRDLLSEAQQAAIVTFLESCLQLGEWFDADQIPDALEAWKRPAPSNRKIHRKVNFDEAVRREYSKLLAENLQISAANLPQLWQQATQQVIRAINSSNSFSLRYLSGEQILVGDQIRLFSAELGAQSGRVVAVAGQGAVSQDSYSVPDWGFMIEDNNDELTHWDEADEDLEFVRRTPPGD